VLDLYGIGAKPTDDFGRQLLLARRLAGGASAFRETANIFRFVCFAAAPSTALSATIGVTSLALAHLLSRENGPAVWLTWWMGDFVSDLVVAPLLLLWFTPPWPRLRRGRLLEGAVMVLGVWFFSRLVFNGGWLSGGRDYPLEYLCIPLLLWAAFRFGQRGAITASCVMSAAAIWGTLRGRGPFAVGNANDSLLLLQSFMGVTTLTMVVLAAVVADRQQAQERERAARTEAERANSAKDQFLAVLSHELRTPLTPVMLAASILENDRALPERVREDIQTIRRNVELEARLIDDLLDLTRITRGKLQLDLHVVDIHELIQRAIDICCRDSRIKMNVKLDAAEHHIRADPARIQQVFWNLLNNAQKFTPEGGAISIRSSNSNEDIMVEVADTGAGIEPDLLPKLFAAFEQGDRGTAHKGGDGLGLGLAISKMLVTAHGGTLDGYSDGRGNIVMLMVAYGPVQNFRLKAHRPEMCYTAAGFRVSGKTAAEVSYRPDATPLKVAHVIAERESRFEPITYWMRVGNDITTGVIDRQLIRLKYGLRGIIPDGALMRVSTIGMPEQASYTLQNLFIRDLLAAIAPQDRKFFTGT